MPLSKITMVYHIKNTMVFWGGTFTMVQCTMVQHTMVHVPPQNTTYHGTLYHGTLYHGKCTAPKYHGILDYGIP